MSAELTDRDREILDARAAQLSRRAAVQPNRLVARVAAVGVGQSAIGLPVENVLVITRTPPVAPLPALPAWVPGIVHVRGQLVAVVDLQHWLDRARPARTTAPFLALVVDRAERVLGLLVDVVLGYREVYEDELAPGLDDADAPHGVRTTTRDLLAIMDVEQLIRTFDLRSTGPVTNERG
jgi:purine-binding chemotaxis protein CheW